MNMFGTVGMNECILHAEGCTVGVGETGRNGRYLNYRSPQFIYESLTPRVAVSEGMIA